MCLSRKLGGGWEGDGRGEDSCAFIVSSVLLQTNQLHVCVVMLVFTNIVRSK